MGKFSWDNAPYGPFEKALITGAFLFAVIERFLDTPHYDYYLLLAIFWSIYFRDWSKKE